MRRIALALALALALAALHRPPAAAQTGSEAEARAHAQRLAGNVVRVLPQWDPPRAEPPPQGYGLMVGRRGPDLYIATPHHVVWAGGGLGARPRVRFIPPAGGDSVELEAERLTRFAIPPIYDDLAVLIVRGAANRAPAAAPLIDRDALAGGDLVWSFGRGDGWTLSGRAGAFISARDPPLRLLFDNLPVVPGMSGAAIVRQDGIVGMLLALQGGVLEAQALPVVTIRARFRTWDLPFDLLDPVIPAAQPPTATAPSPPPSPSQTSPLIQQPSQLLRPIPTPASVPRFGERFRDCDACPELVVVLAGPFTMGSPAGEARRRANEGPQRPVSIRSFAAGVHEVTRGQFGEFVRATGRNVAGGCNVWTGSGWEQRSDRSWRNPGFAQDDTHPVTCVSWRDAQAYVAWLSDRTGQAYRLLTESEWEYAARARTTTAFSTGPTIGPDQAQYAWTSSYTGSPTRSPAPTGTAPVGRYPANGSGLHDMHGNVWEWVQDCYRDAYEGGPSDGRAVGDREGCDSVLRGGSWSVDPWLLRSAFRDGLTPDAQLNNIGFRVARAL